MRYLADLTKDNFNIPKGDLQKSSIDTAFQIVFALAAGVALVILMLAALKYITSRGDPSAVAKAKNTILYAVIGLVIAASAFSIVSFVVKKV
jgi:hypothetical protein